MKAFFLRWMVTALSVMVAAQILPGISYSSFTALLFASFVLGILNALIRPILFFLSLPFIVVTMGIFILIVNAAILKMASGLTPGFHVEGFWTTIFGALIISTVSWGFSLLFREERPATLVRNIGEPKPVQGRVIE